MVGGVERRAVGITGHCDHGRFVVARVAQEFGMGDGAVPVPHRPSSGDCCDLEAATVHAAADGEVQRGPCFGLRRAATQMLLRTHGLQSSSAMRVPFGFRVAERTRRRECFAGALVDFCEEGCVEPVDGVA